MKRPSYSDALEYILERRPQAVRAAKMLSDGDNDQARHILARTEPVIMAAELWSVDPLDVAENVIRLHDLRQRMSEARSAAHARELVNGERWNREAEELHARELSDTLKLIDSGGRKKP